MATNATSRHGYVALGNSSLIARYFDCLDSWAPYAFAAVLPENAGPPLLRLGECILPGFVTTLCFDDVGVYPALPVQMYVEGVELGIGESFRGGHYTFQTQLASFTGNYARPLLRHTTQFLIENDSARWAMASNSFIIYRHGFDGLAFTNALVKVSFYSNSTNAELLAEASLDGVSWVELGRGTPAPNGTTLLQTNLPASLLPAAEIHIRLTSTGSLNVSSYRFEGDMPGGPRYADGNTLLFEQQVAGATVVPLTISDSPTGWVLMVELRNPDPVQHNLALNCDSTGPAGTRPWAGQTSIAPRSTNTVALPLPTAGAGPNTVQVEISDLDQATVLSKGSLQLWVSPIRDSSYGYLAGGTTNCPAWWCEATYKVGRERALPTESAPVRISAARNEYEPFQIVLRPLATITNIQVSVGDLVPVNEPAAPAISSTNVQVNLVDYVPVTEPTDISGALGDHPDPLPLLNGGFDAPGQTNQPVWFTVHVPREAPAGDYEGTVRFHSAEMDFMVPVRLHVFSFTLSDVTHTRTVYSTRMDRNWGFWYQLTNTADEKIVWDYYMDDFRRHRISCRLPQTLAPLVWAYDGTNFSYDFNGFDAAITRYLDEFGFNGFEPIMIPDSLGGHPQFDPEYRRLLKLLMQPIMAHLRQRGWLDEAYTYWMDEPQAPTFPFVATGMQALQEAAPGLRRILTVYTDPIFYNQVETWVPILGSFEWQLTLDQRRMVEGDEFWWYVCTDPDAPWPNNFTDHGAINHRIRPWLAERYGVRGELYWDTSWYSGLGGELRNPWTNAMTTAKPGWSQGNGDGVLLYPPARTPPTEPVIAPPVDSLRWELIREGMEDAEYLWLLKNRLEYAQANYGAGLAAVAEGYAARDAALALVPSGKTFDRNPLDLYAVRRRIAEAIEALDDGAPFMVREPVPRAMPLGESVSFRAEALGWPPPAYQWQFNGVDLDGATSSVLVLSNLDESMAGEYSVVASNAKGMVASAPTKLAVVAPPGMDGSGLPQILVEPASAVQRPGNDVVLAVTAVSSTPLTYAWLFNGTPIVGATNAALAITNLSVGNLGTYTVQISNSAGTITSAPATVAFPSPPNVQAAWAANGSGLLLEYLAYNRPSHIEVSTDLAHWTALYNLLPQPDPVVILDDSATANPSRFYRVQVDW